MRKIIFGLLICTMLIFAAILPVTGELQKIKTEDAIEITNVIADRDSLPPGSLSWLICRPEC